MKLTLERAADLLGGTITGIGYGWHGAVLFVTDKGGALHLVKAHSDWGDSSLSIERHVDVSTQDMKVVMHEPVTT